MNNAYIIGGGIVGLATAYKLSCKFDNLNITVFEKEPDVGLHQSTHNSGVLHCGLYYKPGSLKARLAVDGIKQMTNFCVEYNIPHEICGKLVVATNDEEASRLNDLYDRGIKNGLSGLTFLSNQEDIYKIEPHVNKNIKNALYVPQEGIVDYQSVISKLKELLLKKGHQIVTNSKIVSIKHQTITVLSTECNSQEIDISFSDNDIIINCAGLYSDRVAKLTSNITSKIIPFRGEYYKLKPHAKKLVNNLIYPVPDPKFPFLGVHFTRLINGEIEAGPNAVLAFSREGYKLSTINMFDVWDYIKFKGLWKFVLKHKWMCLLELRQSISKYYFCKSLQKLIPDININDIEYAGSGVRAQAMSSNGDLISDFEIVNDKNIYHVINAPSPAATASLSIADYIISKICNK
jgi:L-2-hydroxyglutarate oxidase